jgi:uncharacterized membrane protein YczE
MDMSHRLAARLARCIVGLALFGVGISMFIAADVGLPPWDVLHSGLSARSGLAIGWIIQLVGLALLLLWIPLRQRPGIGTILNAIEIGLVVNLTKDHLPRTGSVVLQALYVVAAVLVIAVGSGLYIGAGLGAGPRDGIMVGLVDRGLSVRVARTAIEVTVLVAGLLLGGKAGAGTAAFAFGIGPAVQVILPRLSSGSGRA